MITAKGHGGQVSFDGAFVTITRNGFLARATVGKGEKRIPLTAITSVQWKPAGPLVNGFIQFTVPGGNERRSRFGSQTSTASRDENSVVFMRGQMPAFETLRAAVEEALRSPGSQPSPDVVAQIKQLAELRDAGMLSAEEFDAKKTEMLGRL